MLTLLIVGAGIDAAIAITFFVALGIFYWWVIIDEADEWSAIEDAVWKR